MKDLSLHILDIMQNSTAANANIVKVIIRTTPETGMLEIIIEDNGCGMDRELLAKVTDPFMTTRTTRRVGLGIPLFKASAERSGGSFEITSEKGVGTVVKATFSISHIDRPAIGDVAGVIADMSAAWPDVDIQLLMENMGRHFEFSSQEIKKKLGEVPLSEFAVVKWMREYIEDGLKDIFGGVINEIDS